MKKQKPEITLEVLYPQFVEWNKQTHGYFALANYWDLRVGYEFLKEKGITKVKQKCGEKIKRILGQRAESKD